MNALNKMAMALSMILLSLSCDVIAWWPFAGWAAENNEAFVEDGGYRLALENRAGQIWISIEDTESASETFSPDRRNLSLFVDGRSVRQLEDPPGISKDLVSKVYPNRLERSFWRADWGFDVGPVRSIMRASDRIVVWYTNSRNSKIKVEFGVRNVREAIADALRANPEDKELEIRKFEKNKAELDRVHSFSSSMIEACRDDRCAMQVLKCLAQQGREMPKGEVSFDDFNHCIGSQRNNRQ